MKLFGRSRQITLALPNATRRVARNRKNSRRRHTSLGLERLEDRVVLDAGPLFMGLGFAPGSVFSTVLGVSADGSAVIGSSKDIYHGDALSSSPGDQALKWTYSQQAGTY